MRIHAACILAPLLFATAGAGAASMERPPNAPMHGGFEDTLCGAMPVPRIAQVDFHSYFDTRSAARLAAREVDAGRFTTRVRTAVSGPEWLLQVRYRALPTPEQFAADMDSVRAVSDRHGGSFHGAGCGSHPFRSSPEAIARMQALGSG